MADTPPTASATATSTSTGAASATAAGPSNGLLATQPAASPGAGGWTPDKWTPIIVAVFCGIAGSAAPVLMMPEPKWNVILASVMTGTATALVGYFGMRSAGPRS